MKFLKCYSEIEWIVDDIDGDLGVNEHCLRFLNMDYVFEIEVIAPSSKYPETCLTVSTPTSSYEAEYEGGDDNHESLRYYYLPYNALAEPDRFKSDIVEL